jgi:hypothetical protein
MAREIAQLRERSTPDSARGNDQNERGLDTLRELQQL